MQAGGNIIEYGAGFPRGAVGSEVVAQQPSSKESGLAAPFIQSSAGRSETISPFHLRGVS